jgi:hypothetical protein
MIYKAQHNGQKTQDKQRSTKHNTMIKRHKTNNDLQNTTQWSKDTRQTMIYKTQHNSQKTQDKQRTVCLVSFDHCVVFCRSLFVLCLLTIVLCFVDRCLSCVF